MAGQIHFDMTSNPQDVLRAFVKANREVDKLKGKLRDVGRTGQKTKGDLKEMGSTGASALDKAKSAAVKLVGALGIGVGVAGAIATVNRGYETWLENIKLVSSETKQAASDVVAFAALQPVGTKAERTRIATELAASFGITDRGVALGTVQALQSAPGGTFASGLKAAETVFAGTQVGISLEAGTEAERFGAGLGLQPGQMIRNLFVAGQASVLTPGDLAKAAPGLKFFEDPVLGPAFASVLASAVRPEQLDVFTKRAGQALGKKNEDVFIGAIDALKDVGVLAPSFPVPKTQEERLAFLSQFQIDTPDRLTTFGIKDIRAVEALAGVVPNIETLRKTQQLIRETAVPGILVEQRAQLEAELPFTKQERLTQIERARRKEALAFGPLAAPAQRETRLQVTRGRIFAELGAETGPLGRPLADVEGRATAFGGLRFLVKETIKAAVLDAALGPTGDFARGRAVAGDDILERIMENGDRFVEGMDAVKEEIRIQTEVLSGGEPALVPAIGPIDGDTE